MRILRHVACALTLWTGAAAADQLTVFSAASLQTALDEIVENYTIATGDEVAVVYAGSSVLARQIISGAPADLYISANAAWADAVAERREGLARTPLASNRLVLISHEPQAAVQLTNLPAVIGYDRLALALIDAVPAGIYAQAALNHAGVWEDVAGSVVQSDNARSALALVASGAVGFGMVYATDAASEPRVHILHTVPEGHHPQITYPALLLDPAAQGLWDHLHSAETARALNAHGFLSPP